MPQNQSGNCDNDAVAGTSKTVQPEIALKPVIGNAGAVDLDIEDNTYENLGIPVSGLPKHIQEMKARDEAFKKEFSVKNINRNSNYYNNY